MATDIIAFLMTWVLLFHSLSQYTVQERLLLYACPPDARALIAKQGALLNGKLLFLLNRTIILYNDIILLQLPESLSLLFSCAN